MGGTADEGRRDDGRRILPIAPHTLEGRVPLDDVLSLDSR